MPPPLPLLQRNRIQDDLQRGLTVSEIAAREGVHLATIYRIVKNIINFGDHTKPRQVKTGRRSRISQAARNGLRAYIESKPWAQQDEMQKYLLDAWDIRCSRSTVTRTLQEMKISRKNYRYIAQEDPEPCQDACYLELSNYAYQQIAGDENDRAT